MVVLVAACQARTWLSPTSRIVGAGGDAYSVIWLLAWVPHALAHGTNPLLSQAAFAPVGVNVMWQTAMLLPATVLAPVTALAGPVLTYNILALAGPAFAGWTGFLAFRRWTRDGPAFAGALLFAFSPYMAAQGIQHAFLTFAASAPLMLILLDRLLVVQRTRAVVDGALLGLVATGQLLVNEEFLAIEGVTAGLVVAVLLVVHRNQLRARLRHACAGLGAAAGVTLLFCGWPLAFQFAGPGQVTAPMYQDTTYVADAASFLVPSRMVALSTAGTRAIARTFPGNWTETDSYLGLPLIALLALCAWAAWHRSRTQLALLLIAVPAVLSLGPVLTIAGHSTGVPLPWRVIDRLPMLHNLLATRIAIMMYLGAGLLLALGLDAMPSRIRSARAPSAFFASVAALAGLTVLSLAPPLPYASAKVSVPAAFTSGALCQHDANSRVEVIPRQDVILMWQAAAHFCYTSADVIEFHTGTSAEGWGKAVINASVAASSGHPMPTLTPALRRRALAQLHESRTRVIVLGPAPAVVRLRLALWVSSLLQEHPVTSGGVLTWSVPATAGSAR